MARPGAAKRQKELNRIRRKEDKAKRLAERRDTKEDRPLAPGEDPDIAGIVPGPQPLPEEFRDFDDDEGDDESEPD